MQRYEIVHPLGAGGMGTVYRAVDRLNGQVVALKRIEPHTTAAQADLTDAGFLQTLTHEFSILAGLRHPHIISVLDYGLDAQRRPFFTMELLDDAQTIVAAAQHMTTPKRLDLALQLLQALAYLHRRGILHRDLKPANVLYAGETVRVLDFGLASLGATSDELAGTTTYMAPEMLRERQHVPASDLFAVGVLMAQMLMGRLPFASGDPLSLLQGAPDLGDIPDADLRAVLERLLQKRPEERYASAHDALTALAAVAGVTLTEQPEIRESYLQAAPFTGRQAELAQLHAALQAALAGRGSAVLIGGESGIGKSRLLHELRIRALTLGAGVYSGQTVQTGGAEFQLWRQPLAHLLLEADPSTLTAAELRLIADLLTDAERLLGQQIETTQAPNDTQQNRTERLTYLLLRLLEAAKRPLVLLLEDIQWSDNLDVLHAINRAAQRLPLLVLASYRSDDAPDLYAQLNIMDHIVLQRFAESEIRQLCDAMLGTTGEKRALVGRLQRESEGNVFFLIETLRALAEHSATLTQIDDTDAAQAVLPASIVEIVQRRLAFVPDWAQGLLHSAAIAGRQLDLHLLTHIAATHDGPDAQTWLSAIAGAALIGLNEGTWRFSHDKLREALLHMLSSDEKARLSRHVAEGIEALYPDDETQAQRLAQLWQTAGDAQRAFDHVLVACAGYQRQGLKQALSKATEMGLALYEQLAQRGQPPAPHIRVRLLNWRGAAYETLDFQQSILSFKSALDASVQQGLAASVVTATVGLANIYAESGDYEQAEVYLQQAEATVKQADDPRLRYTLLNSRGNLAFNRHDLRTALDLRLDADGIVQTLADPSLLLENKRELALIYYAMNDEPTAEAHLRVAMEIAEAFKFTNSMAACLLLQGTEAARRGRYEQASESLKQALYLYEQQGHMRDISQVQHNLGTLVREIGQIDDAIDYYVRALRIGEVVGDRPKVASMVCQLADAWYLKGDYKRAYDYGTQALQIGRETNFTPVVVAVLGYLVRICLRSGRVAEAQQHALEGLQAALDMGYPGFVGHVMGVSIELLLLHDRAAYAAELYGMLHQHAEVEQSTRQDIEPFYIELEEALDPEDLQAAIQRGAQRDITTTAQQLMTDLGA